MLNAKEKQEMLNDAYCAKRRESFRRTQIEGPASSYDTYLQFLSQLQKVFDQITNTARKPPQAKLKL
jgi:hypothetical protein